MGDLKINVVGKNVVCVSLYKKNAHSIIAPHQDLHKFSKFQKFGQGLLDGLAVLCDTEAEYTVLGNRSEEKWSYGLAKCTHRM